MTAAKSLTTLVRFVRTVSVLLDVEARVTTGFGCEICESWFHSKCIGVNTKSLGDDPYFCDSCS